MDYLLNCYKEVMKPIVEPYGFKLKERKFFVRIASDDMIQTFCLFRMPFNYISSIRFDISPLCIGEDRFKVDGEDICRLWGSPVDWWKNYESSELIMEKNAEDMGKKVKEYLIPYLEKATICRDAYQAELSWITPYEYRLFCYSIKMRDYENAAKHMQDLISLNSPKPGEIFYLETMQDYMNRTESMRRCHLRLLENAKNKNEEFFDELIRTNEAALLAKWKIKR